MIGKTAIVTGGATGIGEAAVRRLCSDGCSVAIGYYSSEDNAKALSSELSSCGYNVAAIKCDVSNSNETDAFVKEVILRFGKPLFLVNNAGIAQQKLFTDITDDDWSKMLDVDLTGAFNMCRSVLPCMIHEKFGSIVNISSMWGQTGGSCEVHYSAAKAGIIGLTKALAKECAPSGIRVNCVSPGVVDTKMMSPFSEEDKKVLCEEIPMGRIAKPSEIASAVSFLLSEDASYITGQILPVNGGIVI